MVPSSVPTRYMFGSAREKSKLMPPACLEMKASALVPIATRAGLAILFNRLSSVRKVAPQQRGNESWVEKEKNPYNGNTPEGEETGKAQKNGFSTSRRLQALGYVPFIHKAVTGHGHQSLSDPTLTKYPIDIPHCVQVLSSAHTVLMASRCRAKQIKHAALFSQFPERTPMQM